MAKRKQAERTQKAKRLKEYVLLHLSEIMRSFTDIQDDIEESRMHPGRSPMNAERKALLEGLADEKVSYIEQVIKDLKS